MLLNYKHKAWIRPKSGSPPIQIWVLGWMVNMRHLKNRIRKLIIGGIRSSGFVKSFIMNDFYTRRRRFWWHLNGSNTRLAPRTWTLLNCVSTESGGRGRGVLLKPRNFPFGCELSNSSSCFRATVSFVLQDSRLGSRVWKPNSWFWVTSGIEFVKGIVNTRHLQNWVHKN